MATITKQGNSYIASASIGVTVFITILYNDSCDETAFSIVVPRYQNISPALLNVVSFTLPTKPGIYKILYEDVVQGVREKIVYQYDSLLISIIKDIEEVFCGCKCSNCPECDVKESAYLSLIMKVLSYNILKREEYTSFLTTTKICLSCNVETFALCNLNTESILGNADNTLLLKQFIAYYYLVFYSVDYYNNPDKAYIDTLYNYRNILKCLKSTNIDYECIKRSNILTGVI